MPTDRIGFAALADDAEILPSGFNSAVSARLTTEQGEVYAKGRSRITPECGHSGEKRSRART